MLLFVDDVPEKHVRTEKALNECIKVTDRPSIGKPHVGNCEWAIVNADICHVYFPCHTSFKNDFLKAYLGWINAKDMSLQTRLDLLINDFCQTLATNYKLPKEELLRLWGGEKVEPFSTVAESSSTSSGGAGSVGVDDSEITEATVIAANKTILTAMCRKYNLKTSGKKEDLCERMLAHLRSGSSSSSSSSGAAKSTSKSNKVDPPVIRNLKESVVQITIGKNRWGNWEHAATGFVLQNKVVVGKQLDNGEIAPLTLEDIEKCKRDKIPYKQPEKMVSENVVESIKLEEEEEEEEELGMEEEVEMEEEVADDDDDEEK